MVTVQVGWAAARLGAAGLQVLVPTVVPTVTAQMPGAWEVFPRIPFLKGTKGLGPAHSQQSSSGAADNLHRDVNEGAE